MGGVIMFDRGGSVVPWASGFAHCTVFCYNTYMLFLIQANDDWVYDTGKALPFPDL
jgi:hypothetical protein